MRRGIPAPTGAPWLRAAVAASALALVLAGGGAGASNGLTETQVKAAYIYNFAKFVEWPAAAFATPQAPLVLCMTAREGLNGAVAAIDGKPVQGRQLQVRRAVKPEELKGCHILFVSVADERTMPELLRRAGGLPVLTIGEPDRFAAMGGCIGFVVGDERVQFEINPEAAHRADLKISSQLLRLAKIVRDLRGSPP